jgi:hypothetical protein
MEQKIKELPLPEIPNIEFGPLDKNKRVHFSEDFYLEENKNQILVNPIPSDFTFKETKVVINADGSRSVAS